MTREIFVRFVQWTRLKFKIHTGDEIEFYFREREIWWCSLGANIGREQDGKHENFERPVLVLKKFNRSILWIIPQTSKNKIGKFYYQTNYKGVTYTFLLSQLRIMSSKRLTRKIRTLPGKEFEEIKSKIKNFLQTTIPTG